MNRIDNAAVLTALAAGIGIVLTVIVLVLIGITA